MILLLNVNLLNVLVVSTLCWLFLRYVGCFYVRLMGINYCVLLNYRPPGKPTRLAPIPKPAPERLVTPMVGM